MTENGITSSEIAILWMIDTLGDIFTRPLWGQATRFMSVANLIIINCLIWFFLMVIFAFGKTVISFGVGMVLLGMGKFNIAIIN